MHAVQRWMPEPMVTPRAVAGILEINAIPPTQPRSDRIDEQPPAVYRPVKPIRLAIEGCCDGLVVFVEGMVRLRTSAASFGPPSPSVLRGRPSAGSPRRCASGRRWPLPNVRSVSDDRSGRCRLRLVHDLAGPKDAIRPKTTCDAFGLRRPPERSDRAPDNLAAVGSPRTQRSRLTGSPLGSAYTAPDGQNRWTRGIIQNYTSCVITRIT